VSAVLKKQVELEKDYKMFRVNALAYWILLNSIYMLALTMLNNIKATKINDGSIRLIDGTAMFLAGIVLYKVIFGSLHILWFKLRVMCRQDFKV